jgi:hypothetical chaperone protein
MTPFASNAVVGIDFGTSNSAIACVDASGAAQMLSVEGEAKTLPTAMFFHDEAGRTDFGRAAIAQYLAGHEGRLMRSIKSLLGSALMDEQTLVHGAPIGYRDIVALFLREMRQRSAAALGAPPRRALIGRPVHFVDDDPARDARAVADLTEAAHRAGFDADDDGVCFALEPIAAAFDYERRLDTEALVLVADIGGGTSDFTVVRLGPAHAGRADRSADILATAGVHIGGTDCDRALNLARVMPLLGLGHHGPDGREVPSAVFFELATWHLIHRLGTPAALRNASALRINYADRVLHSRLMRTLEDRYGHAIAHAVESAKIAVSSEGGQGEVELALVEPGLSAQIDGQVMADALEALLERVADCAASCVRQAELGKSRLDAVYLTGGSSALQPLQAALAERFPGVPLVEGDRFGGVAMGLAWAAEARNRAQELV